MRNTDAMTRYGFHCPHEQYPPSRLLDYVRRAEQAGFQAAMCSDHFHPWLEEEGESGFTWSWLGAAMQATSLSFGTVNAPGDRYHPAIIAQAAATLAELFPGRFWLAVGSGEALNEAITGAPWPAKPERNARLLASVEVMRALWAGETVTRDDHVRVREARLYTRPATPPPVVAAALGEETARFAGGWADAMITTGRPRAELDRMIDAFHEGGGEGKPIYVQHVVSLAPTDEEARREAHRQWRFAALEPAQLASLRTPAEFAAATRSITPDQVAEKVKCSADLARHAAWLAEYADAGIDTVYVHNVNRRQTAFIEAFGERVLPELGATAR